MRTHTQNMAVILTAAAMGVGLTAGASTAAPVVSSSTSVSSTGYTVSSTDLLSGMVPDPLSILGTHVGEESTNSDPAVLTNGSFSVAHSAAFAASTKTTDVPTILVYSLDLIASPEGYSISGIDTYTGRGSTGRIQQRYSVSYATFDAPETFVSLATATMAWSNDWAAKVSHTITDLDGVAALKFDFTSDTNANNWIAYQEIDVFGAPVPEPASLAGLGLAALGLMARRRRVV